MAGHEHGAHDREEHDHKGHHHKGHGHEGHDHKKHDHLGHDQVPPVVPDPAYRKILWWSLWLNFGMFVLEQAGGVKALSVSLLADSIDFFADSASFALTLLALGMASHWQTRLARLKGLVMVLMGLFVLWRGWLQFQGASVPEAFTMGWIGVLALLVNMSVAWMLYRYRSGDANMRSVWLCSRNDAIGNLAVILAAFGVFGSAKGWPDLLVALLMAALGLWSGTSILLQAGDGHDHHGHAH